MELSVRYRCPNCQSNGRAGRTKRRKSPRFSPDGRFAPHAAVPRKSVACFVTLFLKLPDPRLCTPITKPLGLEGKLTLAVEQFVGDRFYPGGIFEHHAVRPL